MADYIYLLENRLSTAQRAAIRAVRDLAKSNTLTIFLVGGAVRDLTTGSPVRDLDLAIQGNPLDLRGALEAAGATITGSLETAQTLFLSFPGSVRIEISATMSVAFPKPGKPVYTPATILDDLRRRDFTANAMALSLNDGSYGLLMDPLNGIADIDNRELRLVSNYGFIEDPVRMVRAARLMARLGWALDEKTQQRYETGRQENYISALNGVQRGYETEEIFHEEDPLRVLRRLEAEGWMQHLAPFWTSAKADATGLEHLRQVQTQLQMQGINPDASAANFPLLTAKLAAKDVATLKAGFVRQGFVKEIDSLEARSKELASLLTGKAAALPSQSWKILTYAAPEAVLSLAFSSKNATVQAKLKSFSTTWPQARQKLPYALMQEMRIVPDLSGYEELLQKLFFELMDDKLQSADELKAFLEPYSPPAPPPPVNLRRQRASKKDAKNKGRAKKASVVDVADDSEETEELPEELDEALSKALETDTEDDLTSSIELDDDELPAEATAERDEDEEAPTPPAKTLLPAKTASKPVVLPARDTLAKAKPEAAQPPVPTAKSSPANEPRAKVPSAKNAAPVKSANQEDAKPVAAKKPYLGRVDPVVAVPKPIAGKASPAKPSQKTASNTVAPAKKVPAKKAAPPVTKAKESPAKTASAKSVAAVKAVPAKSAAKKSSPAKNASQKKASGRKR